VIEAGGGVSKIMDFFEISPRLTNALIFTANSMDECGMPRMKLKII